MNYIKFKLFSNILVELHSLKLSGENMLKF